MKLTVSILAVSVLCVLLVGREVMGAPAKPARVTRGEYLVTIMSCDDCHTNKVAGELDQAHRMAGHLVGAEPLAPPPPSHGPWRVAAVDTLTAWHGPWGVSFASNLTPDRETGLGDWTEDNFVATMREGRRLGKGRKLLPPMPNAHYAALTDDDLRAIFAYLRSLPAVANKVPQPIAPKPSPR